MLKLFAHLIVNTLALLFLSKILPTFPLTLNSTFLLVITLTLLNSTVVPIIKFLTWPINILSLGFFYFFIRLSTIFLATAIVQLKIGDNFFEKILTAILIIFTLTLANGWAENAFKD